MEDAEFRASTEQIHPTGADKRIEPKPLKLLPIDEIPLREWLLGYRYLRGHLTLTIAPGGVGKSMLVLQEAIALATGRNLTGMPVHQRSRVWIISAEDDELEMQRRLRATCLHFDVDPAELGGWMFLNEMINPPLVIADHHETERTLVAPDVDVMINRIKEKKIDVVIVDPFLRTHRLDEQKNQEIDYVMLQWRRITTEGNCAVSAVVHTRKPPHGSNEGHRGNPDSARGASALVNAARIAHTLGRMTKEDARKYGVSEEDLGFYQSLDSAKANYSSLSSKPLWLRQETVPLPNGFDGELGDKVPVLQPVDLSEHEERVQKDRDEQFEKERQNLARALANVMEDREKVSSNEAAKRLQESGYGRDVALSTVRSRIQKYIPLAVNDVKVDLGDVKCRLYRTRKPKGSRHEDQVNREDEK